MMLTSTVTRLTIQKEQHLDRALVLQDMIDTRNHKNEKYAVTLLQQWFPLSEITVPTFIGSFAWTSIAAGKKWMLHKNAMLYADDYSSPADAARDYVETKYKKRRRVTTPQYHEIMRHRAPPLYAQPCQLENAVYVDLKSAYWSIVRAVGWDVDYYPGRWIRVISDCDDFPFPDHKLARNCLVSVGLISQSKMWTGKHLVMKDKRNANVNMVLWAFVQDVLNGIAHDMISIGAVYAHTDGFILPAASEKDAYELVDSWGLTCGTKYRGAANVIAVGTYDIGTQRHKRMINPRPHPHIAVYDPGKEWLRLRLRKFSELRGL